LPRRLIQSRRGSRHYSRLLPRHPGCLPAQAGQLGSTYAIPVIYVPAFMITHFVAFYWLVRPQSKTAGALVGHAVAS
jgi:hypothetical protein